jgi:hypothetical protein
LAASFLFLLICVFVFGVGLSQGEAAARSARAAHDKRVGAEQSAAMASAERSDLLANYKAVCAELQQAQETQHAQQVGVGGRVG